jgi:hypothetical protein
MIYEFTLNGRNQMDVDMTSRGLFGWWILLRFCVGMRIAGWKWEKKKIDALIPSTKTEA